MLISPPGTYPIQFTQSDDRLSRFAQRAAIAFLAISLLRSADSFSDLILLPFRPPIRPISAK